MTQATHPAPLIGSHPAIDFLNTAFAPQGNLTETIGDGRGFLDWMVYAGLLDSDAAARLSRRLGARELDAAAARARKVREWARSWLERWRAVPARDYREELATLNRMLAQAPQWPEVVVTADGLGVVERLQLESADGLIALIARQIAALVTAEAPSLVKSCAGEGCTLWFLDRTKPHRRRFCSAAGCGNRAKVAAWRERRRA
jgi:predicted RNA-binding Zn ribbon-like protein